MIYKRSAFILIQVWYTYSSKENPGSEKDIPRWLLQEITEIQYCEERCPPQCRLPSQFHSIPGKSLILKGNHSLAVKKNLVHLFVAPASSDCRHNSSQL